MPGGGGGGGGGGGKGLIVLNRGHQSAPIIQQKYLLTLRTGEQLPECKGG